ncbi:MAG: hypothetical protein IT495_04215 [Gammaproteobacteria bacterium]|nr:hypothetical protein [Gammaproteobacteria bacterium]
MPAGDRNHQGIVPAVALVAAAIGVAAAVIGIYSAGLHGPWLLDDYAHLPALIAHPPAQPAGWLAQVLSHAGPTGRPLAMSSLLVDAQRHGADVAGWKLTNVLLHVAVTVAVWAFATQVIATLPARRGAAAAGLVVAALWALHPLQVSTVLYVIQRMTELSALFTFAGLALYVDGRRRLADGRRGGRRRLFATFLVCLPLAVLSKETGALLPVLCAVTEFALFPGTRGRGRPRIVVVLLVTFGVLPALALAALYAVRFEDLIAAGFATRSFTLGERLLTELRVLVLYVVQVLVPVPAVLGFIHDDIAVSRSLLEPPQTLWSLLALLAAAGSALALRERMPIACLGVLGFLAAHALEASFLPLELMFEHRNYVPSAFLVLGAVTAVKTLPARPQVLAGACAVALLTVAALTVLRVRIWSSPASLYANTLRLHPGSTWARSMAAELFSLSGQHRQARDLLAASGGPGAAMQGLVLACREQGAVADASFAAATGALSGPVDGYQAEALIALAELGLDGQCRYSGSAFLRLLGAALERPVAQTTSAYKLRVYQAHFLGREHDYDLALSALDAAWRLRPEDPMPLFFSAELAAESGDHARARGFYTRAVTIAARTGADYSIYVEDIGRKLQQ